MSTLTRRYTHSAAAVALLIWLWTQRKTLGLPPVHLREQ